MGRGRYRCSLVLAGLATAVAWWVLAGVLTAVAVCWQGCYSRSLGANVCTEVVGDDGKRCRHSFIHPPPSLPPCLPPTPPIHSVVYLHQLKVEHSGMQGL